MLNSAPVQLLPVEHGNSYKKVDSEVKASKSGGRSFDEYMESERVAADEKPGTDSGKIGKEPVKKESVDRKPGDERTEKKKVGKTDRKEPEDVADKKLSAEAAAVLVPAGLSEKADKLEKAGKKGINLERSGKKMVQKAAAALKNAVAGKGEAVNEAAALKAATDGIKAEKKPGGSDSTEIAPKAEDKKSPLSLKNDYSLASITDVSSKKAAVLNKKTAKGEKIDKSEKSGKERKAPKSEKVKLSINDQRKASREISAQKADRPLVNAESKEFVKEALRAADEADSAIELKGLGELSKAEGKAAAPRTHQSALLAQLKEKVNSQIVKQAGITVKDNGTGEIRLVLKPESLGKVRISLSLTDNHIAGRIIVENNMVREVFESNLENLYKAFGSEGFENGGLEVTVEGEGAGNSGRNKPGGFKGKAFRALDESVPEMVDSEWQYNVVNMVV